MITSGAVAAPFLPRTSILVDDLEQISGHWIGERIMESLRCRYFVFPSLVLICLLVGIPACNISDEGMPVDTPENDTGIDTGIDADVDEGDVGDTDVDQLDPNACGGSEVLEAEPGAVCEECGVWECDGDDAVTCVFDIDFMTDRNHCGECDNVCAPDEECNQGNCLSVFRSCDSVDPPPRCEADVDEFSWEPVSVVTSLELAGEECCVDFTGDGVADNGFVTIFDWTGEADRAEFEQRIQEAIEIGDLIYVFEHDGLEEAGTAGEYRLNFFRGSERQELEVILDSDSIDGGTHPKKGFPDASIDDDGQLDAEHGAMTMPFLWSFSDGTEMVVPIRHAELRGAVSIVSGADGDAVSIEKVEVGGIIAMEELFEEVNQVAAECACLGNPEQYFEYDETSSTASCDESIDAEACEGQCAGIAQTCQGLSPILTIWPDIDLNGNGIDDAVSVGLTLEARPGAILGVE